MKEPDNNPDGHQDADGDDDFRAAMGDVSPLKHQQRVTGSNVGAESIDHQVRRDAAEGKLDNKVDPNYLTLDEVKAVDPLELLEWKKTGVQHEVFRQLKSGKYKIEAQLDLHGHTVKEARAAVFKFFNEASDKGWRTVIVAHGRGLKSATPARLKSYLVHWLGQIPQINAYHSAQPHHGGTGAVYVMVKKGENQKSENREIFGG